MSCKTCRSISSWEIAERRLICSLPLSKESYSLLFHQSWVGLYSSLNTNSNSLPPSPHSNLGSRSLKKLQERINAQFDLWNVKDSLRPAILPESDDLCLYLGC